MWKSESRSSSRGNIPSVTSDESRESYAWGSLILLPLRLWTMPVTKL